MITQAKPAKSRELLPIIGLGTVFAAAFALSMWNGLVNLKAYDLQAVSREKATLVQSGMTHQQVIDLLGRDAAPFPVWLGFEKADDQAIRQVAESVKSSLETRKAAGCSPDRDNVCGTYYTLKDGSGLRIIYSHGVVTYAALGYGYYSRPNRR